MIGVVGTGQVAQHVLAELRRRALPHIVFSRSAAPIGESGVSVSYTVDNIPDLIREHGVTSVINCAAQRDIVACEKDPGAAVTSNVVLPTVIGQHARQVYISTDYVFDRNEENRPLTEHAESKGALSIYGTTKLKGEHVVLANGGVVARISSPWGLYPSPFKQHFADFAIMNGGPLDLPSDQYFNPTYLPDVVGTLVDFAVDTKYDGIYHLVSSGKTDWPTFAQIARKFRKNKQKVTGSARNDKTRPMYGALVNSRLLPFRHWMIAMEEYCRGQLAEERIKR
jgi:dTDP-4-dehydrorhamnose reductase